MTDNTQDQLKSIPDQNAANVDDIRGWLLQSTGFLVASTGHSEIAVKSIIMSAITYIVEKGTDELKQVTPRSVVNVVRDLLLCGLDINTKGHAYITSYRETYKDPQNGKTQYTGKYLAKLDISYKGYVHMLNRAFPDCVIKTFLIWEKDTWLWEEENQLVRYRYLPHPDNRMRSDYINIQGVAVFIEYTKNGRVVSAIEELPIDVLKKIRSKAKTQAVWNEWFDQQAKKAAIRRLLKLHLSGVTDQLFSLVDIENEGFELENRGGMIEHKPTSAMSMLEQEVAGDETALLEHQHTVDMQIVVTSEDHPEKLEEDMTNVARQYSQMPNESLSHMPVDSMQDTALHPSSLSEKMPVSKKKSTATDILYSGDLIGVDAGEYDSMTIEEASNLLTNSMEALPLQQDRMDLLEANEDFTKFLIRNRRMDVIDELHRIVSEGNDDE